jgi:hypothetical protein
VPLADAGPRGRIVGLGAGLAWLGTAAFLRLAALVAGYFSIVAFAIVAAWAIGAAVVGVRVLVAQPDSGIHVVSAVAGAATALAAGILALGAAGSELMWSVVVLAGIASVYSMIARRRAAIEAG